MKNEDRLSKSDNLDEQLDGAEETPSDIAAAKGERSATPETSADSHEENTQIQDAEGDGSKSEGPLAYLSAEKPKNRAKEIVKKYCKRYFIDAFTGMAQGLFCTLIAGTILAQIASWCGDNGFALALDYISRMAKVLMGAGIGVGIAHKLGAKPLVIFSAAVTGLVGAFAGQMVEALVHGAHFDIVVLDVLKTASVGNPIGAYITSLLTIEIAGLYAGKTKLDIVLVPLGMMALTLAAVFVAWPFIKLIDLFAKAIVLLIEAGVAVKVLTGMVVAIVMGILLTMPTSSAAIWVAIATSSIALENPDAFAIAGGAAVAGCAAHMIGFAVATVRENKISGIISQGIGTSMLQIPNIMKKPIIMVPEIVASAISGIVAVLLGLRCDAAGGGMGTSGLVGVFRSIDVSVQAGLPKWQVALGVVLCMFVIPAAVSFLVDLGLRKLGKIKPEDVVLAQ